MADMDSLPPLPLPDGISSRQINTGPHGLSFHILEAGHTYTSNQNKPRRPLILLLHGFPEIAFSWRKVMPLLASAGYYVVAPDQRGYGRTRGWDNRDFKAVDLFDFSLSNLIRDIVMLVHALGYEQVKCIVGHDFGAFSASLCALARPDMFQSLILMSHTFSGLPKLVADVKRSTASSQSGDIHAELAALGRKHYKWHYSTGPANAEMSNPPQGFHEFLRGYFHLKGASWAGNKPHPLQSWSASELVKMPHYYVMPLHASMPEAVAAIMHEESPSDAQTSHSWLPDADLSIYAAEYSRTGFQGGLNWYRMHTNPDPKSRNDIEMFAGKKIECPCAYISGRQDWGTYQIPGGLEKLSSTEVCKDFRGVTLIDGAGHWVPQEKPGEVADAILGFLGSLL